MASERADGQSTKEKIRKLQQANLAVLRKVFAARKNLTKEQEQEADQKFRKISGQLREIEGEGM